MIKVAVWCENCTEHTSAPFWQNAEWWCSAWWYKTL